jgi:hypothetical protein
MALCLMSASFACWAVSPLQRSHIPKSLTIRQCALPNLGHIGYEKYHLLLPGPDYKIFVATYVKFDEQVFDFAADSVKEVTGIRNITGGDDIIGDDIFSDDMCLLADDD